ncbi:MAG: hypothetical protein K6T90_19470 [Leptolyngbyaceae cyanobacterium HOT.MB2.61]|nr:hypothetical protein [Leptolyngbyaceae cyanobacterium HOT.MB2.61]
MDRRTTHSLNSPSLTSIIHLFTPVALRLSRLTTRNSASPSQTIHLRAVAQIAITASNSAIDHPAQSRRSEERSPSHINLNPVETICLGTNGSTIWIERDKYPLTGVENSNDVVGIYIGFTTDINWYGGS